VVIRHYLAEVVQYFRQFRHIFDLWGFADRSLLVRRHQEVVFHLLFEPNIF
jgi:hypothetical protein